MTNKSEHGVFDSGFYRSACRITFLRDTPSIHFTEMYVFMCDCTLRNRFTTQFRPRLSSADDRIIVGYVCLCALVTN